MHVSELIAALSEYDDAMPVVVDRIGILRRRGGDIVTVVESMTREGPRDAVCISMDREQMLHGRPIPVPPDRIAKAKKEKRNG